MMDVSLTVSALRRLGYDDAEILKVVEAISEEKKICARQKAASRQKAFRERNANNAVTPESVTEGCNDITQITPESVTQVAPADGVYINHARADGNPNPLTTFGDILTPLPTEDPQGVQKSAKLDVVSILTECLSVQTANELIAHRKSLKVPLTSGAARRLVRQFSEYGDPEGAASAMMVRGWKGFNPDWLKSARAGPPPSNRNGLAAFARELYGNVDGTTLETNRSSPALRLLPIGDAGRPGPDCADDGGIPRKAFDGFG